MHRVEVEEDVFFVTFYLGYRLTFKLTLLLFMGDNGKLILALKVYRYVSMVLPSSYVFNVYRSVGIYSQN